VIGELNLKLVAENLTDFELGSLVLRLKILDERLVGEEAPCGIGMSIESLREESSSSEESSLLRGTGSACVVRSFNMNSTVFFFAAPGFASAEGDFGVPDAPDFGVPESVLSLIPPFNSIIDEVLESSSSLSELSLALDTRVLLICDIVVAVVVSSSDVLSSEELISEFESAMDVAEFVGERTGCGRGDLSFSLIVCAVQIASHLISAKRKRDFVQKPKRV